MKRASASKPVVKKRTTISISEGSLKDGTARAEEERRNFSNYVEWLIGKDLRAAQAKGGKRS